LCEQWLGDNNHKTDAIKQVVELANIPQRTLKRRVKSATGSALIEYLQNLRLLREP